MNWNPFDLVALGLLLLLGFLGYRKGFLQRLVGLVSGLGGILAAYFGQEFVQGLLAPPLGSPPLTASIALLITFLLGALTAGILFHRLVKVTRATPLRWIDSMAGGTVGLIQGLAILFFVFLPLLMLIPQTRADAEDSIVYSIATAERQPWSDFFEDLDWSPSRLEQLKEQGLRALEDFDPSEAVERAQESLPNPESVTDLAQELRERVGQELEELRSESDD